MSVNFLDLADAVATYYGAGSDQWAQIAQYGISSPEAIDILKQVPGVNLTISNSGKILGWDYDNSFGTSLPPASTIDSNVQSGTYGAGSFTSNVPSSAVAPSSELPNGSMNSGARSTGAGTVVSTLADRASLAVAGVAIGAKLGKYIAQGIYSINPDWYDVNYPTLNPQTWPDLYADSEGGKQFVRTLFGIENDTATMYLDERLLAYTYAMYLQQGAWSGGANFPSTPSSGEIVTINTLASGSATLTSILTYTHGFTFNNEAQAALDAFFARNGDGIYYYVLNISSIYQGYSPLRIYYKSAQTTDTVQNNWVLNFTEGIQFYGFRGTTGGVCALTQPQIFTNTSAILKIGLVINGAELYASNINVTMQEALNGVTTDPRASTQINPDNVINPTTGQAVQPTDNIDDILQALKTAYPDLFRDSIYTDVPQNDGTTERYTYIPVPYPNTSNPTQPTSDDTPNIDPQTQPQVNPQTRPESAQDITTQLADPTTNSPDTGDGDTPPVVPPTGNASSLWAVYNPTQGQVDAFGAWLWSSNFVDQIKKLFSDPMQGIIGLHKIFATPATGAAQTIKVGYLDSGVSSAVVTNQYTTVDCGTVNVAEYFGNVFDYEDTQIRLYLPFIGIVDLSTSDVMRGSVHVIYHVDVITGACLADVNVYRDGGGGVLYQYSGDAAVRYPVSSGSYMGMVSGVLAVVGGIASVATGGALAPAVMGAVSGVMRSKTDVKHSGNFSGAAGAMGAKIPYLIIERPQTAVAAGYVNYQGIGDNRVVTVGSLSGYFKMTDIHTDNVLGATGAEIEQIKTALEKGVIQ